jgi:hypothetical protein
MVLERDGKRARPRDERIEQLERETAALREENAGVERYPRTPKVNSVGAHASRRSSNASAP